MIVLHAVFFIDVGFIIDVMNHVTDVTFQFRMVSFGKKLLPLHPFLWA
jgi:hypothetical protein